MFLRVDERVKSQKSLPNQTALHKYLCHIKHIYHQLGCCIISLLSQIRKNLPTSMEADDNSISLRNNNPMFHRNLSSDISSIIVLYLTLWQDCRQSVVVRSFISPLHPTTDRERRAKRRGEDEKQKLRNERR